MLPLFCIQRFVFLQCTIAMSNIIGPQVHLDRVIYPQMLQVLEV